VTAFFSKSPAAPKICGITSREDALAAIKAGAGALGFNFYPPSPRSVLCADLGWIQELGKSFPETARIAVVVNPEADMLKKLRDAACFDAIQFHGNEPPDFCTTEGFLFPYWIKALRIGKAEDLDLATNFNTPYLLLDASVPGSYGGSGQALDWGLAARFVRDQPDRRVILAGGLTPGNVTTAVAHVHPHAVDVASGVEASPGKKDQEKIRKFIEAAS